MILTLLGFAVALQTVTTLLQQLRHFGMTHRVMPGCQFGGQSKGDRGSPRAVGSPRDTVVGDVREI
jgi:hypothetical protein